jgi:hypothetical protein
MPRIIGLWVWRFPLYWSKMKSVKRPYVELNTSYWSDPRVGEVSIHASGLFLFSIFRAKDKGTINYVFTDQEVAGLVKDSNNPIDLANELVGAGLFIRVDGGYRLATNTKLFRLHTGE